MTWSNDHLVSDGAPLGDELPSPPSRQMNGWQKWLSHVVGDDVVLGEVFSQRSLTSLLLKEIRDPGWREAFDDLGVDVVEIGLDREGKEIAHTFTRHRCNSVIRNSIRRFIDYEWLARPSPGYFVAADKTVLLSRHKGIASKIFEAERCARGIEIGTVASYLGHKIATRVQLIESGRVAAHVWEAHSLFCLYGIHDKFVEAIRRLAA